MRKTGFQCCPSEVNPAINVMWILSTDQFASVRSEDFAVIRYRTVRQDTCPVASKDVLRFAVHAARSNSASRRFAESLSEPLPYVASTVLPARRISRSVFKTSASRVQSTENDAASNRASVARLKLSVK